MLSRKLFWVKHRKITDSEQHKSKARTSALSDLPWINGKIPDEYAGYDYETWLLKFRTDFMERWQDNKPSGSTGLNEFEILAKIGEGTFGRVHLARHKASEEIFAVKTLSQEKIVRMKQVSHVINEKSILFSTRFPFLISLRFATKDECNLYLGLPFIAGGDFFTLLRRRDRLTESETRFYSSQMYMALEYLHNVHCIYRDLKPENILIDEKGYLKLSDFGFSKRVENRTMTLCGTPEYLAPEILCMKPYGKSVDWWAFGVLLYEMISGQSPFVRIDNNTMAMYSKICKGDYKTPSAAGYELRDLIVKLLEVDISKRLGSFGLGCKEIQQHPFFKPVNWSTMLHQQIDAPFVPKAQHMAELRYFKKQTDVNDIEIAMSECSKNYSSLFQEF